MSNRAYNPKDLYIAKKLRERRLELKLKQKELARSLGLTSQQLFKYEKGIDRIPASRLYEFSKLLAVPLLFFFDENELSIQEWSPRYVSLPSKKVYLKFLKLKAILVNSQTQEEYEVEIS